MDHIYFVEIPIWTRAARAGSVPTCAPSRSLAVNGEAGHGNRVEPVSGDSAGSHLRATARPS